jgi:tripartite-type tricarboxylate transporter receptor subunit TctC
MTEWVSLLRFGWLAGLAFALFLLAACGGAEGGSGEQGSGDDYPSQPVSYVLPFDPGGESDVTARLQQGPLEEALGTSVTVSNQPGGGGALGWSELTRTEPDGYTIMGHNLPHIIMQPLTRDDAGYETEQIKQAYIFQSTPNALVVPADSPIDSLEDFVEEAEENPGSISVGGSGEFTANHVGTLEFGRLTDVELTYVPFSGTGSASPALLGGQVDALMTYNTAAIDLQDQGAKVLAVASEERAENLPDVPTFNELGYEHQEGAYRGVAVPPETPDEIVDTIAEAFREVNEDPETVEEMNELGYTLEDMGPEEAEQFTQERQEDYTDLLQELDLIDD